MNDRQRTTLVAFLAYFVLSGLLSPVGIVSGPMAELYGRPVTEITRQFSFLTVGNLVGAVASLFVFGWWSVRRVMIGVYATIALGLLSLAVVPSLSWAGLVLGLAGTGSGIGLAGAALTISRNYDAERRASMLIITDGCFSIGGFLCASLATVFIGWHWDWSSSYRCVGLLALCIVALSLFSRFPEPRAVAADSVSERWPLAAWLCIAALFLYSLGQYSMLFWLPQYASGTLGVDAGEAGSLVGRFWLGMFVAQLFVAWWVFRIGLRRLVLIAATTTMLGSFPLWLVTDPRWLPYCAFLWGVGNLSMLKALLSFATTRMKVPAPRLVSALLLGATVGTALSPAITSAIVERSSPRAVMMFTSGCYVVFLLLVIVAASERSAKRLQEGLA